MPTMGIHMSVLQGAGQNLGGILDISLDVTPSLLNHPHQFATIPW